MVDFWIALRIVAVLFFPTMVVSVVLSLLFGGDVYIIWSILMALGIIAYCCRMATKQ